MSLSPRSTDRRITFFFDKIVIRYVDVVAIDVADDTAVDGFPLASAVPFVVVVIVVVIVVVPIAVIADIVIVVVVIAIFVVVTVVVAINLV